MSSRTTQQNHLSGTITSWCICRRHLGMNAATGVWCRNSMQAHKAKQQQQDSSIWASAHTKHSKAMAYLAKAPRHEL